MKLQALLIVGFTLGLAACAEKEQAAPVPADDTKMAAEEVTSEMPTEETEDLGTAAFVAHMHHHASQLGRLKAALEVGSLAAAQRPAYWLSGHDGVSGVPEEWQVYVTGMREAADAVASAPDIATARAATKRIEDGCVGCHKAAGVDAQID